MFRNFNIEKFSLKLLPPILRTTRIKALLLALIKPLKQIVSKFNALVALADVRLSHGAFTGHLAKYLNDLFGLDGEIYIEDRAKDMTVYLHRRGDDYDGVYMSFKSEEVDTLVLPSERPGRIVGGFAVMVPEHIATEENLRTIRKWVEYYKYVGTNYTIEIYG